jgi:hypothetical protein
VAEKFFVVECDTEYSAVYVYEVSKDYEGGTVNYHRSAKDGSVVNGHLTPKFYGKLDALLVTADKIKDAKPIVPEKEPATQ